MKRETVCQTSSGSAAALRAKCAYRAALERLIAGKATHPDYAGQPVRITPAAVAREARRSRNPLYTTHRELLIDIEAAAKSPTPAADLAATVTRLKTEIVELRAAARRHAQEKQALATENLALLHRAKQAEDRLSHSNRNRLAGRDNLRTFETA
jgi:hypothetical protein